MRDNAKLFWIVMPLSMLALMGFYVWFTFYTSDQTVVWVFQSSLDKAFWIRLFFGLIAPVFIFLTFLALISSDSDKPVQFSNVNDGKRLFDSEDEPKQKNGFFYSRLIYVQSRFAGEEKITAERKANLMFGKLF